jgi:replicative DNA helicase
MKVYEEQLIARMIQDKGLYFENADTITSELFTVHADIFAAYYDMVKAGKHPTLTKLIQHTPNKKNEIKSMVLGVDYNVPVEDIIAELDEARRAKVINNAMTRAGMAQSSDDKIKHLTDAITGLYRTERTALIDGYTAAKEAVLSVQKKQKVEIPTGFKFLDALTGGLQRSDLFIVAGETSQGKTALALNITQSVLDAGRAVVFLSMEMSVPQLMLRMVCTKSGVPKREAVKRYPEIEATAAGYASSKFFIADVTNNGVQHIMGIIRGACIRHNIDVAVVDYLQLMSDKSKSSREQEIGHIARSLKNLAKELNICIMLLSQLGRPRQGQNHKPTLSRLRDSGQIEEAADVVMFVYRPEYYGMKEYNGEPTEGMAELIIAKGRNYGIGSFAVDFEADITRFSRRDYRGGDGEYKPAAEVQDPLPF